MRNDKNVSDILDDIMDGVHIGHRTPYTNISKIVISKALYDDLAEGMRELNEEPQMSNARLFGYPVEVSDETPLFKIIYEIY